MKLLKVTESNKAKFEECVKKDKPMLVLFYANWCPHCQMFEPTWKKITEKLHPKRNIQVAEIEFSNMSAIPNKYKKVKGFPTIQVMKGGKVISEYNGLRTEQDVLDFALRHIV